MTSEWRIKVTYNSENPMKYCELSYTYKGTQKSLEKKYGNTIENSMKIMEKLNLLW